MPGQQELKDSSGSNMKSSLRTNLMNTLSLKELVFKAFSHLLSNLIALTIICTGPGRLFPLLYQRCQGHTAHRQRSHSKVTPFSM